MREKDEFETDDGDIAEGILWRDELEFGSTDGIWRLADEGAITNFMESENLIKCSRLIDIDRQRSRMTHLVASQSLWPTSKVVCKKLGVTRQRVQRETHNVGIIFLSCPCTDQDQLSLSAHSQPPTGNMKLPRVRCRRPCTIVKGSLMILDGNCPQPLLSTSFVQFKIISLITFLI